MAGARACFAGRSRGDASDPRLRSLAHPQAAPGAAASGGSGAPRSKTSGGGEPLLLAAGVRTTAARFATFSVAVRSLAAGVSCRRRCAFTFLGG